MISTDGGREPLWSPDGRELFYRNGDQMMVVSVSPGPELSAGRPQELFEGPYEIDTTSGHPRYDVSPDGQRFLMVGRAVILQVKRRPQETRQTVLRVWGLNDKPLQDIRLTVRQGEILGLVGVAGNGQKPLVETICGLRRPQTGQVRLMGKDWAHFHGNRRWDGNLSYIPEDRQSLATCRYLSLTDNFLLTTRQGFCRGPWLQRGKAEKRLGELIQDFDIQPPNPRAEARQLSGGNLQKMVLAREFFRRPRLIVAEQPTQGLDIAATEDVWQVLLKARERAGILLVTGDLAEALSLSDRLAVMFNGRIVDTFEADNQSKIDRIGLLMAGVTDQPAEPAPVHMT